MDEGAAACSPRPGTGRGRTGSGSRGPPAFTPQSRPGQGRPGPVDEGSPSFTAAPCPRRGRPGSVVGGSSACPLRSHLGAEPSRAGPGSVRGGSPTFPCRVWAQPAWTGVRRTGATTRVDLGCIAPEGTWSRGRGIRDVPPRYLNAAGGDPEPGEGDHPGSTTGREGGWRGFGAGGRGTSTLKQCSGQTTRWSVGRCASSARSSCYSVLHMLSSVGSSTVSDTLR